MSPRSRRFTRFLVTAGPTARLTINPTLAGSRSWTPSARRSRWPTTDGRPARAPVRTVSANSAPRRIRNWDGRIRHSAGRGPCACGRRGWRARPGCACAAGNHASSRGADCSAGTCAYSLELQVGTLYGHARRPRAVLGFTTGYHLEHRRLPRVPRGRDLGCGKLFSPGCPGHGVQRGSHVHNMWIGLWIVSAARDGEARGAHR